MACGVHCCARGSHFFEYCLKTGHVCHRFTSVGGQEWITEPEADNKVPEGSTRGAVDDEGPSIAGDIGLITDAAMGLPTRASPCELGVASDGKFGPPLTTPPGKPTHTFSIRASRQKACHRNLGQSRASLPRSLGKRHIHILAKACSLVISLI